MSGRFHGPCGVPALRRRYTPLLRIGRRGRATQQVSQAFVMACQTKHAVQLRITLHSKLGSKMLGSFQASS